MRVKTGMNRNHNATKNDTLLKVLFIMYLVVLTWIILFKMNIPFSSDMYHVRSLNLIPLRGMRYGYIDFQMLGNIELFIPLGLYLGILAYRWPFWKKCLVFAGVSISYEIIQYVLAIGITDITDVIMNVLGGIAGVGVYWVISKICRTRERTRKFLTVCALVATVLMVGMLILLLVVNM